MGRRRKGIGVFANGTKPGWYLYSRYEQISTNGKKWSNWFRTFEPMICEKYNKDVIDEAIKKAKENCKEIDRITKLKHEFEAREITSENDPLKEYVELNRKYREIDEKKAKKNTSHY